jgi:hypothetical protein
MKSFFEWLKLNEMALGQTFKGGGAAFHGADRKIMGEMFPKIESKLKSFLQKLDFVTIHMYFGTPPVMAYGDSGEQWVKKLRQFFFDGASFYGDRVLGVKLPKSDIVFVKQGSFADALSPWMILHTFAHSVIDPAMEGTTINRAFGNYQRPALEKKVWEAVTANRKLRNLGVTGSLLYIFFPMGSLRKDIKQRKGEKVQRDFELNDNELFREMFVYYLTKGGKIPVPSDYKEKLSPYKSESEISEILASIQELSDAFKNILEACRGDVFTDSR